MSSNDLVSIAEVKGMLKFETDDDDARLSLMIGAASLNVLRFIKSTGDEYRDSNGDIVLGNVEDDIKLATVLLVSIVYQYSDGDTDKLFESDRLPAQVESVLQSRREPTLA